MRRVPIAVAVFAVFVLAGAAVAETPARLSGSITFSTKSVGLVIGVEWGSGTMTLSSGRVCHLRVRTLKAGMIGVESVSASGRIYNLDPRRPDDIAGTFASIGGGITVGGGVGAQRMRNQKGVIIEIDETSQGLAAKIAGAGVAIDLQR